MRSDNVTKGSERAPNRSLFYALGYTKEELERPLIGVVSAYSEIVPGHMNLDKIADAVKAGVEMAGGTPILIPAIGVCDGIAMGHVGMKYSLASRELICDSVETMLMAHQLDGLVLVPNCDKIVPGMVMAAVRMDVPAVVCSGGPMLAGTYGGEEVSLSKMFEAVGAYKAGMITEDQLEDCTCNCCPSCGSCSGMYTANSMNCLCEAIGIALPGNGTIPAVYSKRLQLAKHAGMAIMDMVKKGITQHIGAYQVQINGKPITFLDTPGHEAFTSMRARGAMVTDIAILVVAADDGIMPQTIESINHAKAAEIPIIVAINKMDKPEANPERIKQQLTEHGLVCEEWGGDTIVCPISAKTGMGVDNLLEMLTLTAEVGELKANPNRAAQGTVIEARLDKGRGPVATLLVQNGTLHQGDIIIAGTSVGRVRAMLSDKGQRITDAGPSVPVEITGLSEAPSAGATFNAVADEKLARELVEQRKAEEKAKANAPVTKVSLEDLFSQIQAGEMKNLNLIVKADVQGSVEAVKASLEKLSNEEVRVRVIHGGVGAINESDVMLASTSQAIIVGFNVRPDAAARDSAARANVDMRMYRVIYDAINEIEAAMKGMLAPKFREVLLGHAEVRQTYKVSGVGTVAGCYVQDGKLQRKDCQVRLVRDGIVIHEGILASLQRFKDSVKEVAAGYECGLSIEKFNDIKEGDIVEAFTMEQIEV